jgi:membrane protease YdiL (CAAX protease family)
VQAETESTRPRLVAWLVFVIVLAGLGYAARFSGASTPDDLAYRYSSSIAALIQYGVMLGVLLLISIGLPRREVFALERPASWPRAIGLAAAGLAAIWGVSAALARFLDASDEQGLVPKHWDSSRAAAFVVFFVVVTVVAPFVEELTYRGLGFTLLSPFGVWVAIVLTGFLFAAAHGLVIALPVLTFFGIVVGWLRAKTESVYPGMLLHGTFNGVALIVAVTIG